MAKLESEIIYLEEKLTTLNKVANIENKLQEIHQQIEIKAKAIKEQIDLRKHTDIRKLFNSIISQVLNTSAIISITQNKQGNVEFKADIQNLENLQITAQGEGTSYKKLLCMAFDLSILSHYSASSYYRFVYHDGALEGLDDRKKINYLKVVRKLCDQYNLQYILTLIDSDLPKGEQDEIIPFSDKDICLELDDKDNSGKLFEVTF